MSHDSRPPLLPVTDRSGPPCYTLEKPKRAPVPILVDTPHSGAVLPEDFEFICDLSDLRQSDEFYVDRFAEMVLPFGGTLLKAVVSRAYIDLNRPVGDLHPSICDQPIPWPLSRSRRVMYGIGLIRHLVRPHQPVYGAPLSLDAIKARISNYYDPYYAVLGEELHGLRDRFGRVLHINLHGMPGVGVDGGAMPDIVLGDHDGHSCGRVYREMLRKFFEAQGLKVAINAPYKGVELTRRFARPRQGVHCLQVEVNKALFMDEASLAPHEGMDEMRALFRDLWAHLAGIFNSLSIPQAAE